MVAIKLKRNGGNKVEENSGNKAKEKWWQIN